MSVAVVDEADRVLAVERTYMPRGDGHRREIALSRLAVLPDRLQHLRQVPVQLCGYCYDHTGVEELFVQAGWTVVSIMSLNDVVGIYGLSDMVGHVIVGGCGSWPQVVYVDNNHSINWPGEDVASHMPQWLLSGWAYAHFLLDLSNEKNDAQGMWLRREVREKLGGDRIDRSDARWGDVGPMMTQILDWPEVRQFLRKAVDAVLLTQDVIRRERLHDPAPSIIVGGGAVWHNEIWRVLETEFWARGIVVHRVTGEHAVGLARYAKHHPKADPWAVIGRKLLI